MVRACGVDLAVSRRRCTGYAVVDDEGGSLTLRKLKCLHSSEEVIEEVATDSPDVVAVDAPLSGGGRVREVERAMWRSGFKVLPPSMPGMRELARAGEALAKALRSAGFKVVETHPKSALRSSGVSSFGELLKAFHVSLGAYAEELSSSKDLRDALISALVAYCVVRGCAEGIAGGNDVIYILKPVGRARCGSR